MPSELAIKVGRIFIVYLCVVYCLACVDIDTQYGLFSNNFKFYYVHNLLPPPTRSPLTNFNTVHCGSNLLLSCHHHLSYVLLNEIETMMLL